MKLKVYNIRPLQDLSGPDTASVHEARKLLSRESIDAIEVICTPTPYLMTDYTSLTEDKATALRSFSQDIFLLSFVNACNLHVSGI